ncbi:MgtC/SapB family protein [Cupriavidus sp. SZY C1]|uniref:MgtC/SapB family protein n=1 Tax=Cupriavidus sp. SZY C1 TaxID=3055037 RepID=UPI0028B2BFA6|nr:MgtC/SapB family protein [Cupriavidus sp. SZY C1]MDT6961348.1 MgtC/SapB family protein [Cupriavidus sp. SZY C1]
MDQFSLELFWRLLGGLAAGAIIGLDRNLHGKAAGMRTLGLVSLGAAAAVCVVTLNGHPPDAMSRVLQGLLTGVGFLGVGVIARHGVHDRPQGLTTAAGIWMAAILGAAAGAGYYAIVVISLGLGLVLLRLGGHLENRLHARFDGTLSKPLPKDHDDAAPGHKEKTPPDDKAGDQDPPQR